jgi:hypothetical protein
MVTIDEPTIQAVLQALIALILALVAWWQHRTATTATAAAATTIAAFTPGTVQSKDPVVVASLPARTWTMDAATLDWLIFDATPENKALIIQQINDAENQKLTSYQIRYAGGFYQIEYGLLKGGAGNPSGKKTN